MTDAIRFPGGEMADLQQSSLGNRTGIQGDKTDDATEQADAEKQKPELVEQELGCLTGL